jgi:hypothetical protein
MLRNDGRLVRRTLGSYPQLSLAEARKLAREQLSAGADPTAVKESKLTWSELVERYCKLHLKPSARSWKNIRARLSGD